MSISFNFILQATRILHVGNYDDDDLQMVYDYLISLDNEILNEYLDNCTIFSYNNDLELYIEIVEVLVKIFEDKEEYEKCAILMGKIKQSESIIKNKKS